MASGSRPKGTSSKQRGKAARGEKSPTPKTVKWKGLSLLIPAQAPEEIFVKLEFDRALSDKPNDQRPLMKMLRQLLGDEQFSRVREKATGFEDITSILDAILGAYGLGLGE